MKRLFWLFLAVLGTAFAQVQPVALASPRQVCPCCAGNGSCGMPDCPPPPVSARTMLVAAEPARIVVAEARRAGEPARPNGKKFFATFVEPVAVPAAVLAPDRVQPPASVPLFAAHCSLLI